MYACLWKARKSSTEMKCRFIFIISQPLLAVPTPYRFKYKDYTRHPITESKGSTLLTMNTIMCKTSQPTSMRSILLIILSFNPLSLKRFPPPYRTKNEAILSY
jgi:hypothetical protein